MKLIPLAVIFIAITATSSANLLSPDGQHLVEYFDALPHEANVVIKNVKTGKPLIQPFSSGYDTGRFLETAWSPDSRYLAVVSRGTTTTGDLSIFSIVGDSAEEARIPDYRLKVLFDTSVIAPSLVVETDHHDVAADCVATYSGARHTAFCTTHALAECYSTLSSLPLKPRIQPM